MTTKKIDTSHPYNLRLLEVSFSVDVLDKLPGVEKEILCKLTVDRMTVKQIAKQRGTSLSAVKNMIKKLRNKNLMDKLYNPITNNLTFTDEGSSPTLSPQHDQGLYRLHGQNHSCIILSTSHNYFKILEKNSKLYLDSNTVMLHRRKIIIYSNTSFYDNNPDLCFEKSNVYWHNFIIKLEKMLGIKIIDGMRTEIKIFRCHIAKTDDMLAKKVITNNLMYKVKDDLGRTRLIIDNSKGLFEFEAVDTRLCQDDINRIKDFHDDLITKDSLLPSELTGWINNFKQAHEYSLENGDKKHNELLLMFKAQLKLNEQLSNRVNDLEGRF